MKTTEQILEHTKERARELVKAFKSERELMRQHEPNSPFHEEHYKEMMQHSRALNELQSMLNFITTNVYVFYDIYDSIKE